MYRFSNKLIILNILIINLVLHQNSMLCMNDQVPSLVNLAGKIVGKRCKSIKDLVIPEDCHKYLGLVKLEENVFSDYEGTAGGRILDNNLYLCIADPNQYHHLSFNDLVKNKDFLRMAQADGHTGLTFEKLIREKINNKLTFILAVVTTEYKGKKHYAYYTAQKLKKFLKKGYPFVEHKLIGHDKPTITDIRYYAIDSNDQEKAQLIGTYYDKLFNPTKKKFIKLFISANKGNAIAQNKLGCLCEIENNIELARHYYMLSAEQNNKYAQCNLAGIYEQEHNIEKAKYYYTLAACQGDEEAQAKLLELINLE